MKVSELRKALEGVPDDMDVVTPNLDVGYSGKDFSVASEAEAGLLYLPETGGCYRDVATHEDAGMTKEAWENATKRKVFLINTY